MATAALEAFKEYDAGGSGTILRDQLAELFMKLDPQVWNPSSCQLLLSSMGSRGANIDFTNFVQWVMAEAPMVDFAAVVSYVFGELRKQEGCDKEIARKEAGRYLKLLVGAYGRKATKGAADSTPAVVKGLLEGEGVIDEVGFGQEMTKIPKLKEAMEKDWDPALGRLKKFRTCSQQMSKLLGNIHRLTWRAASGEDVAEELLKRQAQAAKFRKNGVLPDVGLSVFNQIDVDKSRTITWEEFTRMLTALSSVYDMKSDEATMAQVMKILDSDASGTIDEEEWCDNLELVPELKKVLEQDMDPLTGRLKSFRTPEEQYAKLLGNIERCEFDKSKGKDVTAELQQRRKAAQKYRAAGVKPSCGVLVFNQLDLKKQRTVTMAAIVDLVAKIKTVVESPEEIMSLLDANGDKVLDEKEWIEGLDRVPKLKAALEADVDPESGKLKSLLTPDTCVFDMLRRQEGVYAVDKNELGRYLKALRAVYGLKEAPGINAAIEDCMANGKDKVGPDEWTAMYESMPKLKEALEADYLPEQGRFKKFRSCGQQLSKLQANLDRLKLRSSKGEDVAAEITSRSKMVRKFRNNGVWPSPGLCVFNQIDFDKSGEVSKKELERLFRALSKVFPVSQAEIDEIWKILDSDSSGEVSEEEWMINLRKCPKLRAALAKDLDPDTGHLRSYRSNEEQLAKLLGNIQRLEYDKKQGKDVDEELASRREQAKKWRDKGVTPSPGIVVFNQLDLKKKRSIKVTELQMALENLKIDPDVISEAMVLIDADGNGFIDEDEWLHNLEKCPLLVEALKADMDPDTGMLRYGRGEKSERSRSVS